MSHPIDLRSDTVTKPTPEMLKAMFAAEVGDDVYGEDPSINLLEEEVAALLGKEAAIYVPTGTMANQIAINLHTNPGETVMCEENAHVFRLEAGAPAALSGVMPIEIRPEDWTKPNIINDRLFCGNIHVPTTTLLEIENTHNLGGGRAFPVEVLQSLTKQAHEAGLKTHCDGARLWNAAIAVDAPLEKLASGFDSVSVCFSKGLGAPVGSALASDKETIERARTVRKRFGGAMRQAGYLAEAVRFAINHHFPRMGEDHRRAKLMFEGLKNLPGADTKIEANYPELATNMVYLRLKGKDGQKVSDELAQDSVLISHLGDGWLRAVLHQHIDDEGVSKTVAAIGKICAK